MPSTMNSTMRPGESGPVPRWAPITVNTVALAAIRASRVPIPPSRAAAKATATIQNPDSAADAPMSAPSQTVNVPTAADAPTSVSRARQPPSCPAALSSSAPIVAVRPSAR